MATDDTDNLVVTGQGNRLVTTGCLTILIALITVLGLPVSWLWYRHWHDEKVNSERRDKTFASTLKQARDAANDTTRALNASNARGTDVLMNVIWRHTKAPVITYDPTRRAFTATAAKSAFYNEEGLLPGGGPVRVMRCFVFTYAHRPSQMWSSRLSERENEVCRPGTGSAAWQAWRGRASPACMPRT